MCNAAVMAEGGSELPGPAAGRELRRWYWIGGSPCAGKSSVAAMLATRHGLLHVECDVGAEQRLAKMSGHQLAAYEDLSALGTCRRLARPPQWQAERELAFYREQFDFLLAELAALPAERPAIVEGADLLPDLLQRIGVPMDCAVWMVPTPDFQLRHYAMREWVPAYLQGCPDPEQAFHNWMRRDVLFAKHVRELAASVGGRVIVVESGESLEEAVGIVERHFRL
jgi:hypothetical protein